jgi:hypothetical protein
MPIIQSKMDGFSNMLKSNKKAKQADMLLRLEACSTKGANSRCAECPARNPKWASILVPPASATIMGSLTTDGKKNRKMTTGKRILGVFICQKCTNFHLDMGRSVCAVKNTKAADQCKFVPSRVNTECISGWKKRKRGSYSCRENQDMHDDSWNCSINFLLFGSSLFNYDS